MEEKRASEKQQSLCSVEKKGEKRKVYLCTITALLRKGQSSGKGSRLKLSHEPHGPSLAVRVRLLARPLMVGIHGRSEGKIALTDNHLHLQLALKKSYVRKKGGKRC